MPAVGRQFEDIYFHGTSQKSAENISEKGFSAEHSVNGQSAGVGVYLHSAEHKVRQYGDHTVAATLPNHLNIHPNIYNDEDVMHDVSRLNASNGRGLGGNLHIAATMNGYHGHIDPDDKATVVYNPRHVEYLSHHGKDA